MKANPLIGKTLKAVYLAEDGRAIRFDPQEGEPIIARCDGDCCSYTWIENVEAPETLIGSEIVGVQNIEMPDLGNGKEQTHSKEFDGDSIAYYGLKITTAKGACVLDYRNESNGYYGGSLSWPGDYYYGGVHGQNVSEEGWRLLAGSSR